MKNVTIEIKQQNYAWLESIANQHNRSAIQIIESLVNQKIEENMRNIIIS